MRLYLYCALSNTWFEFRFCVIQEYLRRDGKVNNSKDASYQFLCLKYIDSKHKCSELPLLKGRLPIVGRQAVSDINVGGNLLIFPSVKKSHRA